MAGILRGDIYWADLNPVIGSEQGGLRPVRTLSVRRLREKLCTVSAEQVNFVVEGLNEIIGKAR